MPSTVDAIRRRKALQESLLGGPDDYKKALKTEMDKRKKEAAASAKQKGFLERIKIKLPFSKK